MLINVSWEVLAAFQSLDFKGAPVYKVQRDLSANLLLAETSGFFFGLLAFLLSA